MTECSFFNSDTWDRRVKSYVGRTWDLDTYLRKVEDTDVQERIEEISDTVGDEPSEIAVQSIGESKDGGSLSENPDVDISIEKASKVWKREQDWIPEYCPHEKVDGEDFCCFHLSPERYSEAGIRPEDVDEQFLNAINTGAEKAKTFVGSIFRSLKLPGKRIETHDNRCLDLRLVSVEEKLDCNGTYFEPSVNAEGAIFCHSVREDEDGSDTGTASNRYVSLEANIDFKQAHFEGSVDFKHAIFGSSLSFNGARFKDICMFNYAEFGDDVEVWATFDGKADFSKAIIRGKAQIRGEYRTAAIFNYTTFERQVILWNSTFGSKLEMLATTFKGSLNCEHATFDGVARIIETEMREGASFDSARFTDQVELRRLSVLDDYVSLSEASISSGIVEIGEEPTYYDVTEATLGDVSIEGVSGSPEDLLAFIRISRTDFEGFDFGAHDTYFKPDWRIDRLVDWPGSSNGVDKLRKYETLEESYLRAKSGAAESGH